MGGMIIDSNGRKPQATTFGGSGGGSRGRWSGGTWNPSPDGFFSAYEPAHYTPQQYSGSGSGGGDGGNPDPFGLADQFKGYIGNAPTPMTLAQVGPNRFERGLGSAETRLKSLLDNPDSINESAAYKFRVGQGQEALNRNLAAKGMLGSGNRLMELTKYGQDMGSQEYDAQFGRLNDLLGNYSQNYNVHRGDTMKAAGDRYITQMQGYTQKGRTLADLLSNTMQDATTRRGQSMKAESDWQANEINAMRMGN